MEKESKLVFKMSKMLGGLTEKKIIVLFFINTQEVFMFTQSAITIFFTKTIVHHKIKVQLCYYVVIIIITVGFTITCSFKAENLLKNFCQEGKCIGGINTHYF